jgi:hypothetical protein
MDAASNACRVEPRNRPDERDDLDLASRQLKNGDKALRRETLAPKDKGRCNKAQGAEAFPAGCGEDVSSQ